ncbi:histone-like nucleoid-structuring protein Lsr2 [Actinomadura roseirufa]|uniref:histone-like nucleoid-structuring protein Lsr2 n=1 Tax=Actinomadura roseirufa TaxID=2094049 RepID=UPI0010418271|nr:Lsr2 family protein [Actinomadura roseirufa]
MAQQVKVHLLDDIDGGRADETVRFGIDGIGYEIDLSGKNAKKLRKGLEPFVAKARKPPASRRGGRAAARGRTAGSRERSAEIREWAKSSGIKVNDRGRIPATVVQQYEAAH